MGAKSDRYTSSRSAGTKSKPDAHFVRFTHDENELLHKVTERTGDTIQSFLHEAAMTAIHEYEDKRKKVRPSATPQPLEPGRGFGLREKLANIHHGNPPPRAPETPPAPVVAMPQIVIATGAPSSMSEIDRFAAFVAKGGSSGDRDRRLRQVVEIIDATADAAEKTRLGRALDDRLAAIEGTPKTSFSPLSFLSDMFFGKTE